jgi:hypothetical protein
MRSQLLLAFVLFLIPTALLGQQYRVETNVFRGAAQAPFVKTLTLFNDGVIYDFSLMGDEITVFDLNGDRFVLLNVNDKVKTTLTTYDVLTAVSKNKAKTTDETAIFYFAANPKFETTADEPSLTIELNSEPLTYVVSGTIPQKKTFVRDYQSFADWSARLNSLQSGLPPFARMEVNKQVADLGWAPESVELTMRKKNGFFPAKEAKYSTTHKYNWTLSNKDKQRIDEVGNHLANFTELPYVEYRNGAKTLAQADK